jgi:S-ribosylhomocysteine lyase LuxS involved in autoinducer biosynthesis
LRKIFGPKRDEVIVEWSKLHTKKLHYLYFQSNIFRAIKSKGIGWAEHVAPMGERRGVYRILVEKPEEKRLVGRRRRGWEDNIKMDL